MQNHIHLPHWHRAVHAVHFGALTALVALTFLGSLALTIFSPLAIRPAQAAVSNFAPSSFWNASVPAYTSLHPQSAALVSDITRQVGQYGASFSTSTGSSPVYVAEPNASTVTVLPYDCGHGILPDLAAQWQAVPIPFYAVPSAEGSMIVYQPSSGTVWEFGHMTNVSSQWQACDGGRTSTGTDGVFPSPYGLSSSGLATLAGQLNQNDINSGYINHVIGLSLPQTNGSTWPATQSGGAVGGTPAQGMRFRLDPSINVNNLGLSTVGVAIAKAAQTYGFVIWNNSSTVGIVAENPISLTTRGLANPYLGALGPGGTAGVLVNFPWEKLQALPTDYGQSAPVPAITQLNASATTTAVGSRVTLSWQSSNISRCAIPGIGDNLPAQGTSETLPLQNDTVFVLRCGGPAGTASSQIKITVSGVIPNDPAPEAKPSVIIDQPYTGYANILPELMNIQAAEGVYKVVYYDQETYVYETAKPPFALDTMRMTNGNHTINARVYYRDGRTDKKSVGIVVNNSPETLFGSIQSGTIQVPSSLPLGWAVLGALLSGLAMFSGSWWGWHKAHLLH